MKSMYGYVCMYVWFGVVWCCMVWYGLCGMVWYGMCCMHGIYVRIYVMYKMYVCMYVCISVMYLMYVMYV